MAGQRESRLDGRIEALVALKASLTSCIACGCLSLRTCALANPDDVNQAAGPGARYLPAALRPARTGPGAATDSPSQAPPR